MHATRLTITAVLFAALLPSCSGAGDAATPNGSTGRVVDSSDGTVALGLDAPTTYKPAAAGPASLTGVVSVQGAPTDSLIPVRRDTRTCGDTVRMLGLGAGAGALPNALVWVEGITSGKPLPDVRRQTLKIERCRLEPRVLATVTGATINVFSRDPVVHDLRFFREGSGEAIAYVHTVDDGQVVPTERVAGKPGIVETRCTMHPWMRGYVAVFEHPYFAVTDEKGAFTIDGLPAGTYGVKVWHQGMDAPVEQRVVVGDGGAGRLDVAVALR